MRVLAFVPDLMDRSRMRAPGAEVVFVSDPSELVGAEADLVVLDLSRPGVVEALPGITALNGRPSRAACSAKRNIPGRGSNQASRARNARSGHGRRKVSSIWRRA